MVGAMNGAAGTAVAVAQVIGACASVLGALPPVMRAWRARRRCRARQGPPGRAGGADRRWRR
jgi:hypothetical protein